MKLSAPIYQLKRRAKLMARTCSIPLHEALDRIAREEGFSAWSHLSSQRAKSTQPDALLSRLAPGDMLLLAARPGHGKTLLGLQLLLDAAREGRKAVFFTLEYTEEETRARIQKLGGGMTSLADKLEIVTSGEISASYIISQLSPAPRDTVAVIDYLQILDQQRSKPSLLDQVLALRRFARDRSIVLAFVAQIDRSYDPATKPLPDIHDVRLPNPIGTGLFDKACFLHGGKARLQNLSLSG